MKRLLFFIFILLLCSGCSNSKQIIVETPSPTENSDNNNGVIKLAYQRPVNFKHFEVYISKTTGFNPSGWNGSVWSGQPNPTAEWNGTDKTLHTISAATPIQVTGLTPGTTYYVKVVAVNNSDVRSAPGEELSCAAGAAPQRSSTLVIAASNASTASKEGADYVCDGTDDQTTILQVIQDTTGSVVLTEGTFIINNSITIPANKTVTISGQGMTTILKIKDGINSEIPIFTINNANDDVTIKEVMLDGNSSNNPPSRCRCGIFFDNSNRDSNLSIQNANFKNFYTCGCDIRGGKKISIIGCKFFNNVGCGLYLYNLRNGIIANNQIFENAKQGLYLTEIEFCSINSNSVVDNRYYGIIVNYLCNHNQIFGNTVIGNGNAADDAYPNITLLQSSYNSIQTNVCHRGTGSDRSSIGIRIDDSGCTGNLISNNDCYQGGVTAGISNSGTSTNFGSGNRNNDGSWSTNPN